MKNLEEKITRVEQAAQHIRDLIKRGEYTAGDKLPSDRDLGKQLSIPRPTIRAAYEKLQRDNLVKIIPKVGTFLKAVAPKITHGTRRKLAKGLELVEAGSFMSAMQQQGKNAVPKMIEPSTIIPAGEHIGEMMQTRSDTPVLRRYRVHLVDNTPYRIVESFYLARLTGGLLGNDEGYTPLFEWLYEQHDLIAEEAEEILNARIPNEQEQRLLGIGANQPVFDIDRWVWSDDGTLFEYSRIVENAALHEHTYTYKLHLKFRKKGNK